jgi:hypothetical protein
MKLMSAAAATTCQLGGETNIDQCCEILSNQQRT